MIARCEFWPRIHIFNCKIMIILLNGLEHRTITPTIRQKKISNDNKFVEQNNNREQSHKLQNPGEEPKSEYGRSPQCECRRMRTHQHQDNQCRVDQQSAQIYQPELQEP